MPHFVKSHGLGNDYIVIDPANIPFALTPTGVEIICHRNFGVGSDGILEVSDPQGQDFGVRIWNPDGSEAEKSGNGTRIFAKFLYDHGYTRKSEFTIHTLGGVVSSQLHLKGGAIDEITMDMGRATFDEREELEVDGRRYPVSVLSVGNPHCVMVVDDLSQVDFYRLGPAIENHPAFPHRINVQFVQVQNRGEVRIRIWERGAGETLASGTSSCAVAAACHRLGLTDAAVLVRADGGDLRLRIAEDGEIWLTGPVEEVCSGDFSPELIARVREGRLPPRPQR